MKAPLQHNFFGPVFAGFLSVVLAGCGGADPSGQAPSGFISQDPESNSPLGCQRAEGDDAIAEQIFIPVNPGSDVMQAPARYFGSTGPHSGAGIVFVTGIDGGFIEPLDGVYGRLAARFARKGIPSIFVQYRSPGEIEPSIRDAAAAAEFLKASGVSRIALVGWSFGGAVTIHAATHIQEVVSVVAFAPQALDTEPVAEFRKQSLLLIHSYDDDNVPFESSLDILERAPETIRKELVPVVGADHYLSGYQEEVEPVVHSWIERELVDPAYEHVDTSC